MIQGIFWIVVSAISIGIFSVRLYRDPVLLKLIGWLMPFVLLIGLMEYLGKTRLGHWGKGGCLGMVAVAFLYSGLWLYRINLKANRAEHLSPFGWNTGFGLFWALIGGGFAWAAYRAFKQNKSGDAPITRRLGSYRWSGLFIVLIAIWTLICIALLSFIVSEYRAHGISADSTPSQLIALISIISLLGPGLLTLVLVMQWRSRHHKFVILEWTPLSTAAVDGILQGTLRIAECPQDLTQIHLGLRLELLDSPPLPWMQSESLQLIPIVPEMNSQGIWQCESVIVLPIPKAWVPRPDDPSGFYPDYNFYVGAALPEWRWTLFRVQLGI